MNKPGFFAVAATTVLVGCAGTPDRPIAELAEARSAIELAEQSGAQEHSTALLTTARNKLARAESLSRDGDHDEAARLADQAEIDARLAAAKASLAKTEAAASQLQESLSTLERELDRS